MINLKVKTLDSQTYEFAVDDEITVRQFKDTIAEKTSISAELQRIIYCGRVLADEKQLKEYDVNGKVVHVVERAPPNLRSGNSSTGNRARRDNDGPDPSIRASPLFRALDGMVIGAMTVPVNANGATTQPIVNPSSSFCMNRITVARHMLDCANNIALFLENPERGLNNPPLDILTLGRFTMESTVVEVGISADSRVDPQNQTQNLVEALNSAVNAAFRQSGNPNFTVTQLPTVFRVNGSPANEPAERDEARGQDEEMSANSESTTAPTESNTAPNEVGAEANDTSQTQNERNNGSNGSGQTTCTRVLAEVYSHMRSVQTRLDPFYQQYYEILQNDPTFEESDSAGRENAQRIYDRVSEAMHYMAHAQHAISDLMLDLSQPAPRHLCCRPILVEQSGYVSSNNYLASFLEPNGNNNETTMTNNNATTGNNATSSAAGAAASMPAPGFTLPSHPPTPFATATATTTSAESNQPTTQTTATTQSQTTPTTGQGQSQTQQHSSSQSQQQQQTQQQVNVRDFRRILSHMLQPVQVRYAAAGGPGGPGQPTMTPATPAPQPPPPPPPRVSTVTVGNIENDNQAANPQIQMARLIQAVVNSAPIHADVHVQINGPNLLQYGIPVPPPPPPPPTSQTPAHTPPSNGPANVTEADSVPRVTTATHPTTSTQTRSTARPQVHISNLPPPQMWNARVIPTNMVSSFDRFLPCSSHHIRESEQVENPHPPQMPATIYTRNRLGQMRQARRHPAGENSTIGTPRAVSTTAATNPPASSTSSSSAAAAAAAVNEFLNLSREDFNIPIQLFGSNLTLRDIINLSNPAIFNRIRDELYAFIVNNLFAGTQITNENMNGAIDQVIQMLNSVLVFLPQFDLPDYDARASVENFLRNTLPIIINLVREDESNEFGTRLLRELISFVRRMFVILVTCIGRSNAELYLNQVAQMTITSNNPIEQEALRSLHGYLMSAIIRELDMTRQSTSDVQEFLVIRRPPPESNNSVTLMETDETPVEQQQQAVASATSPMQAQCGTTDTTLPIPAPVPDTNEPLPAVVSGSEPWHTNFPSHWLPIITRDIDRQRKQSPQPPYSDAYISGMSAKRRKLVASTKPPSDVNSLFSDGVRRALQTVGVSSSSSSTSIDEVTSVISSDPSAQLSYREALRSNIQERLKTDPDFNADKFPNSSKYFHK